MDEVEPSQKQEPGEDGNREGRDEKRLKNQRVAGDGAGEQEAGLTICAWELGRCNTCSEAKDDGRPEAMACLICCSICR